MMEVDIMGIVCRSLPKLDLPALALQQFVSELVNPQFVHADMLSSFKTLFCSIFSMSCSTKRSTSPGT